MARTKTMLAGLPELLIVCLEGSAGLPEVFSQVLAMLVSFHLPNELCHGGKAAGDLASISCVAVVKAHSQWCSLFTFIIFELC